MYHMLSILIPCYNGEQFLNDCITNILKQNYQNFEVLIINDGSTDRSKIIIDKYVKTDDRIILINLKKNIGINKALLKGLKKIKNPYLCIISVDDRIVSNDFFAQSIKLLQDNKDCALVFSDPGEFFETNNKYRKLSLNLSDKILRLTPQIYKKIMKRNSFHIPTNSMVHRTCFFVKTGFKPNLEELADWTFSVLSSLRYNSIYIPKNFVYTRIHSDSYSAMRIKSILNHNKIINEVYKFLSLQKNRDIIDEFINIGVFPKYNLFYYIFFISNFNNIKYVSLNQIRLVLIKNLWYLIKKLIPITYHEKIRTFLNQKVLWR